MKKITATLIKAGAVGTALFGFAFAASAATWTPPTATPPGANVPAPINVSTSHQFKAGGLGIGRTSAPSWFGPTTGGSIFDVNGTTSTDGLANFGASQLVKHVTIGNAPCIGVRCGTGSGTSGGTTAPPVGRTSFLFPEISKFFSSVTDNLKTTPAYAAGTIPDCGRADTSGAFAGWYPAGTACHTDGRGIIPGNTCQPTDFGTMVCTAPPTTGGGGVGADTIGTVGTVGRVTEPVITFNASPSVIPSGSASLINWSATNASSCGVTSTNGSNNWNSSVSISSSTRSGSGSRSLGTFATDGSYSYTMTCTSPSGGRTTAVTSVTVGPAYILDVYGNSAFHGYVNVDNYLNAAALKQGNVPVCLKNGVNCPPVPTNDFGPYPKIYSDMTNEYAVYGANPASGGGNRVQISGSAIRLGPDVANPVVSISGGEVGINGTSNRNSALLKVTTTGSSNGDNAAGTERGLTVAASSAAGQGKLLNVKRGTTELFNVAGNGNTYVPSLVIGPDASGNGIPMYRLNPHCATSWATNSIGGRYYNLPLTTQKWCGENDNLWYNDKNAPATYVAGAGTPGPHYYAGKLDHSSGTCRYSMPTGGSYRGCDYNPVPVGYIPMN